MSDTAPTGGIRTPRQCHSGRRATGSFALLVATCVDEAQHAGTCLAASNRVPVGETAGRGRFAARAAGRCTLERATGAERAGAGRASDVVVPGGGAIRLGGCWLLPPDRAAGGLAGDAGEHTGTAPTPHAATHAGAGRDAAHPGRCRPQLRRASRLRGVGTDRQEQALPRHAGPAHAYALAVSGEGIPAGRPRIRYETPDGQVDRHRPLEERETWRCPGRPAPRTSARGVACGSGRAAGMIPADGRAGQVAGGRAADAGMVPPAPAQRGLAARAEGGLQGGASGIGRRSASSGRWRPTR